jgi:imidazolonepropionase-like amidohydrolase
MDPIYAIKATTYWPSKMVRVDDKNDSISEGKYADIISVKGHVLKYISLLQDVHKVLKHGKLVNGFFS